METATINALIRRDIVVAGLRTHYFAGGSGPVVVLLHGCALTGGTYRAALEALIQSGVRVFAPAMPGFGCSDALCSGQDGFGDYARWVNDFLDAVGVSEPVTLVGHSFGGGVAIRTAHDWPGRVRRLVLVNAIGGSAWLNVHGNVVPMHERPLWDWVKQFPADSSRHGEGTRALRVTMRDILPNLLVNTRAVFRVANLARGADLALELAELARRGLPTSVLHSDGDRIVPTHAFEAMKRALGAPHTVTVPGNHSWLLTQPHRFAGLVTTEPCATDLDAA